MRRKKGRKLISKRMLLTVMVSLTMVLGLMPGMSLKAYADDTKAYATYDVTTDANKNKSVDELKALQVTFNGKPWYIISDNSTAVDAGTVTILAGDTSFGVSLYREDSYSGSKMKANLDALTASGGSFADVADAIVTNKDAGGKLYLLSTDEAEQLSENVLMMNFGSNSVASWWLRSPNINYNDCLAWVSEYGKVIDYALTNVELGIRPALKLELTKVSFDSDTKTFQFPAAVKPAATVTKAPTAKSLSYTGQAQELVNAGTAEGGTIQYALGTDSTTAPTTGYTSSIPTGTNAGTYYVWYKAKGDDKHTDSEAECVTVTISKEDPEPGPDPKPEPKPEPKKKDKKSSSSSESSTPPNPNALNIIYIKNGTRVWEAKASKQVQGPAAQLAFKQIMSPGCNEAFSFNLIADGKAIDHTLKNGKLILFIPDGSRKAGRVFALTAIDKNGKVHFYPDTDSDPATVTVDVNFEGYAFDLIYIG